MHKIVDKAVMADGTEIQLEDWSDNNTPQHHAGWLIGAYPIAKETFGAYRTNPKSSGAIVYVLYHPSRISHTFVGALIEISSNLSCP